MCDKLLTKYKDILNQNQSDKPIVQGEIEMAIKMELTVRQSESVTKIFPLTNYKSGKFSEISGKPEK